MSTIIGISGKIGSGKNYLAEKLMQELESLGHTIAESSFAGGLRAELNRIIKTIKVEVLEGNNGEAIIEKVKTMYNLTKDEASLMYSCLINDIVHIDGLNANSRTESIRRALQILGTDIRRNQDHDYWVKMFFQHVPDADFVLVTDVRFPNEADAILHHDGILLRLELSQEIIDERTKSRDGILYSEEAKTHPSEVALDDYKNFSFIVESKFDARQLAASIINSMDIPKRIEKYGV
jgi:hypothetical protein